MIGMEQSRSRFGISTPLLGSRITNQNLPSALPFPQAARALNRVRIRHPPLAFNNPDAKPRSLTQNIILGRRWWLEALRLHLATAARVQPVIATAAVIYHPAGLTVSHPGEMEPDALEHRHVSLSPHENRVAPEPLSLFACSILRLSLIHI